MDISAKNLLFRKDDGTAEAVSVRIKAARIAAGFVKQTDFAKALGISKTTYNTQEKLGKPAISTIRFLYVNHRIDFNYVFNGDFNHLPGDVQLALETALAA
ncbi:MULTISPECIES: helix-turn-helix domain-containing protein [Pacificibacter]|uniref:helix-turn-helix domain-containing protein n=1 Tax=Pacificibacter TaxID=1042323 RepID=UPI001C09343F|nr:MULTISPECIES: helix-turn-helix transcriptional regulator [Pacificibacter]MBU2936998.1 helix-turn-helix domain-containing protein [Pacificibacter marinus]MDO6617174.1 helix-turn-helix transcriptional regulator [Pacificibacter sp. 1_MG-2023]